MAAVTKAAAGGAHVILSLERNAAYRISRPLVLKQLKGFELHGNGAQLVNTTYGTTLHVSSCEHVTISDLTIDYDPLPFTQGVVASMDHTAKEITLKVDPGYPDSQTFLSSVSGSIFAVVDRNTRALKAGARDFLSAARAERLGAGSIRVQLAWSANDTFPSQLPVVVGDVVIVTGGGDHAVMVENSLSTSFVDVKLFSSPGMGILENGGPGGTLFQRVSIAPGPPPAGARTERLVSTASDGSHFITVVRGPTMEDCVFSNTCDDAVNVHGFYYYVIEKTGPGRFLLTPKWDIGLEQGDVITACDGASGRLLGKTHLTQLTKRHAPELKAKIAQIWKDKSPTTQPDLVYDVVLEQDLPLKVADAVTSLSRIGAGTTIRRCRIHSCGRVIPKGPDAIVEDCQFGYTFATALQAGPDIGYWAESGFAENLVFRNNRFSRCGLGCNELTAGNDALGVIYIGMTGLTNATGFENNFQNRNILIAGNVIQDSYLYAIFVANADGLRIADNMIGQSFIRGAFDGGKFYGVHPDSAIYLGRTRNAEITGNLAAPGHVVKTVVGIDRTCDARSIQVGDNRLV